MFLSARTIKCLHTGSNVINDEVLEIVSSLHRYAKEETHDSSPQAFPDA